MRILDQLGYRCQFGLRVNASLKADQKTGQLRCTDTLLGQFR
jgi:uncharacterized protein YwbE